MGLGDPYWTNSKKLVYTDSAAEKENWRACEQWWVAQAGGQDHHTAVWDAYHDGLGPVQIKSATCCRRSDGSKGQYVLWREQHESIAEAGGWYVFVIPSVYPNGIYVIGTHTVRPPVGEIDWIWIEHRGERKEGYIVDWEEAQRLISDWERPERDPL